MRQHDYDMYGHQPGCAACAQERDEAAQRDRAAARARNTLSKDRASSVTVTVQIKTGSAPAVKVSDTFRVAAGAELDPMSIATTAQRLGYQALRAGREH